MNLLNDIRSLEGTPELLGMYLFKDFKSCSHLPRSFHLFGCCDPYIFSFVDGFQDTVFCVWTTESEEIKVSPLAYDFREFLRLIRTCGSAYCVASLCCGIEDVEMKSEVRSEPFWEQYSINPVPDVRHYLQTVRDVIDTGAIMI